MTSTNQRGFTIIETMLFLGITSLLIVGVLVSAGSSINIQRYRDSVTSLQSTLQQQYAEALDVSNDTIGDLSCEDDSSSRGRSDCVLMGRVIRSDDGVNLSMQNVVGVIPKSDAVYDNDIAGIKAYNIYSSSIQAESYTVDWGASLKPKGSGDLIPFTVLIVRSPVSGAIKTFIDDSNYVSDNRLLEMVTTDAMKKEMMRCVEARDIFAGGRSAVVVRANASSGSGIETLGEATSGC
jgi:type II secretory pathway pseudopilin PulG